MTLQAGDIEKLANLAKISVDQSLISDVTEKLDNVLTMIDQLQAINADNISPMAHPLDMKQRLREDVISEQDQHQKFQENAPAVADGLYLVPIVID